MEGTGAERTAVVDIGLAKVLGKLAEAGEDAGSLGIKKSGRTDGSGAERGFRAVRSGQGGIVIRIPISGIAI